MATISAGTLPSNFKPNAGTKRPKAPPKPRKRPIKKGK